MSMEGFWKRVAADLVAIGYVALSSLVLYIFFDKKETFAFALFFQCLGQIIIFLKIQYRQSYIKKIEKITYWLVFIFSFSALSVLGFAFNSFLVQELNAMDFSAGFNVSNFPVFSIIMSSRLPWYYFFFFDEDTGDQRDATSKKPQGGTPDAKSKDS